MINIIFLMVAFLYANNFAKESGKIVWKKELKNATYGSFDISPEYGRILIIKNNDKDTCKSKVLVIDLKGTVINQIDIPMLIWSVKFIDEGNYVFMDGSEYGLICDLKGNLIEKLPVEEKAFFLNDSFIVYGENFSGDGGEYAATANNAPAYIKKIGGKNVLNKILNVGELLDVINVGEKIFFISRDGPTNDPKYKLSFIKNIYDDTIAHLSDLPVNSVNVIADEMSFVNDSLILCRGNICTFNEKSLTCKKLIEQDIDKVRGYNQKPICYCGLNVLLYSNEKGAIKAVKYIGENEKQHEQFIKRFVKKSDYLKILNSAYFKNERRQFAFFINDDKNKIVLLALDN